MDFPLPSCRKIAFILISWPCLMISVVLASFSQQLNYGWLIVDRPAGQHGSPELWCFYPTIPITHLGDGTTVPTGTACPTADGFQSVMNVHLNQGHAIAYYALDNTFLGDSSFGVTDQAYVCLSGIAGQDVDYPRSFCNSVTKNDDIGDIYTGCYITLAQSHNTDGCYNLTVAESSSTMSTSSSSAGTSSQPSTNPTNPTSNSSSTTPTTPTSSSNAPSLVFTTPSSAPGNSSPTAGSPADPAGTSASPLDKGSKVSSTTAIIGSVTSVVTAIVAVAAFLLSKKYCPCWKRNKDENRSRNSSTKGMGQHMY